MRRPATAVLAVAAVAVSMLVAVPAAGARAARPAIHSTLVWRGAPLKAVPETSWSTQYTSKAFVTRSPATLAAQAASGTTIANFSDTVNAGQDGHNYTFTMAGSNPVNTNSTTTIQAQIIPITVTFTGTGDVFDPLHAATSCGETQSALAAEESSPEFKVRPWYAGKTFVGDDQYPGAQMREEYWSWTNPRGASPDWHLRLAVSSPISVSLSVTGFPEQDPGTCQQFGEIDNTYWGNYLKNTLIPSLKSAGVSPTTLPIFLVKNIVLTNPNGSGGTSCCVFGFHNDYDNPSYATNTQTYAWTTYLEDGWKVGGAVDVAGTSHEVSEWANDPYVTNPVPKWGHIGQDPKSCQGNLEVGDPMTGQIFAVNPSTPGGFTFHLQELSFFGWFYDFNSGVNGWYSTRGTFTSGSPSICS